MLKSKNNQYKIINHNVTKLIITSEKHGEFTTLVDTFLLEKIKKHTWSIEIRNNQIRVKSAFRQKNKIKNIYLSRYVMDFPERLSVDHIDGDPLNNRLINLRACTVAENSRNRKTILDIRSGIKGVDYCKGKWRVRICVDGVRHYLGSFDNIEAAQLVYDEACIKYHGKFARTNESLKK